VIGVPSEEDKSFVTDLKAIQYLSAFPMTERIDLSKKYPGAGPDAIDLLNKMLLFNPYFRITIDEALNHPLFARIRKPQKEVTSKESILIEFDQSNEALDRNKLRELFLEEIRAFKSREK
jgi:serine/threonine protein kinase